MSGARLPVLLYHHVGPRVPGTRPELTVSPRRFEQQLRLLSRWGYASIIADEWVAACAGGVLLPRRPVLLTFDDAYADIRTFVLPLVERMGLRATVFAVSDRLGATNSWDAAGGAGPHRLMAAADLAAWAARGVEVGAHGRTHADLTTLDGDALRAEVRESAGALEEVVGGPVRTFAYPYGAYDARTESVVRTVYASAFTTDEGLNDRRVPLHRLRRTMVQPSDTTLDLWCRVTLGWSPLQRARALIGAVRPQRS